MLLSSLLLYLGMMDGALKSKSKRLSSEEYDVGMSSTGSYAKVLSVGVEPTTLGLLDPRSNQLSYESFFFQIMH